MLSKAQIDIAPVQFTVTTSRTKVVDFLDYHVMSQNVFLFKRHMESTTDITYFFNRNCLLGLSVLLLLACAVSIAGARTHKLTSVFPSLSTLGSLVNQGVSDAFLATMSMKIFFLTMFLFGICLTALFSARLSSLLAVSRAIPLAKSFQDIVRKDLDMIVPGRSSAISPR